MMRKLFNKKTAKIYIALICITMLIGIISSGFCIYYSSQYNKIIEEKNPSTASDLLSSVASALTGDEESTDALSGLLGSVISALSGDESEAEQEVTPEEKAALGKKTASLVVLIVFYVLCLVFSAGTITCYQYEKYLDSPKYKAKLKRIKKQEKIMSKQS